MSEDKTGLKLNDQSYTIFLNTKSSEDMIPPGFENFFRYINGDDVDDSDDFVREIHEQVIEINCDPEWRDTLMTLRDEIRIIFEDDFREAAEKAKAQGLAEGKAEAKKELIDTLIRQGIITPEQAKEL